MKALAWIVATTSLATSSGVSIAAPPDFSICDGLAGVALGLCRGGIAAGCDGANGGTEACVAIEMNYRQLSGGGEPPWVDSDYPVNTISVSLWVGLDIESGVAAYDNGVIVFEPAFSYCTQVGTCDSIDLTNDFWVEAAGDSGNPFLFFQKTCRDPDEPGIGGVPEYVVLRDIAFGGVTGATIDSATFDQAAYQQNGWGPLPHLGVNDTLIIHTCAGNYFKVGNQKCNFPGSEWPMCMDADLPEYWTRFDYQMLRPAP